MKLVPFSEVVVDMKRGPFGSAIKKEHFVPDGYKVYEQQNAIYDDHTLGRYFINTKKFKELEGFQVSPGDFLVSCSGTLGKVTRIPQNAAPGVINQALLRLRIDERKIDPVFFLHLFRSEWVQGKFVSGAKGVAIKNFAGVKELKQIEVPLFSIEQQKKISEKIESLFAEIDSGTQELQSAKQKLELYKQSVLNSAIQGKLVPQDAKDEPVLKLLERIRAEKEKLIKEKKLKREKPLPPIDPNEVPFELPKEWEWVRFGELCELINGDRSKNYPNRDEYVQEGIPWINTGHIEPDGSLSLERMHHITRKKFDSLRSGKISKGDLVYCLRGATLGKTAFVEPFEEGAVASSLVIIRPNRLVNRKYIYFLLTGPYGKELIGNFDNGSAQPNLSADSLKNYPVPLPPYSEQLKIAEGIALALDDFSKMISSFEKQLLGTQALKQSILKSAFEGKLI